MGKKNYQKRCHVLGKWVNFAIVHNILHSCPPEFAVDGNEGSAGVLGDGDLLPGAGDHGVGARVEGGGEDEPRRHVPQQRGRQQVRHRQQLLDRGQGSLVGRRHF